MKNRTFLFLAVTIAGVFLMAQGAFAWIIVGDNGDSGWQTFSNTFDEAWTGSVGLLVSNFGDTDADSVLLVDNFSVGSNPSFESGDLTGFIAAGSVGVVTSAQAFDGTTYTPTDGSCMARLLAEGEDASAIGGTDGSVLGLNGVYSFAVGDTFSVNWAFLGMDGMPFNDFSLLGHLTSGEDVPEWDELGRIGEGVIPEPASMVLVGIGLAGVALRRRRKAA